MRRLAALLTLLLGGPAVAAPERAAPEHALPARAASGEITGHALPPGAPVGAVRVWVARQSGLCLSAILGAADRYGIPPNTLGAIARVETGRPMPLTGDRQPWPWTVNAGGVSHFFVGEPQAVAWTRDFLVHSDAPVDVGCMQVDLKYHPHAFANLDEAFDPVTNANYAASLLRHLAGADGNLARASGLYHSGTAALADPYRGHVGRMQQSQRDTLAAPVTAGANGQAVLGR